MSSTPTTTQQYYTALEEQPQSEDKTTVDETTPSVVTEPTLSSEINAPPSFKQDIKNSTFIMGEPAQLKCIVVGNPTPQVNWFVDGDLITNNE